MRLKTKIWGPLTFRIDRPKGTVKKWPTKTFTYPVDYGYFPRLKGEDGEGLDAFVGDDPEGHLESFLKMKPDDKGKMVPDETKFIVGLTDKEREIVYRLYGKEVVNRKIYKTVEALQRDLVQFKPERKERFKDVEKDASLNARPSVDPGSPASRPLWQLREEAMRHQQEEAESLRAAAVKTKKGKNIPPLSDLRGQAIKAAMDLYGVKSADLDKVLQGMTLFSDQGDATSPGHAHAAEASSKADKLDRVFKSFDDRRKEDVGQGTESSEGSLMQGSVIG